MPGPEDKDIWKAYAAKVKPIAGARVGSVGVRSLASQPDKKDARPKQLPVVLPPSVAGLSQKSSPFFKKEPVAVFDRRMERRLREGSVMIEGRLDLHGMTQSEAYTALHHFVAAHIKAQHRVLLIITGKGRGGDGVLRTHLPGWLQSLPDANHILALRPAALRHGGGGAFYILLRRKKEKV